MTVDLDGIRVLLVEDEVMVSMLIEDMLEILGCKVVGPAASVDEALALIDCDRPDCAILDVNLAGTRVYPVADALRLRSVPYAFSSGYGSVAARREESAVPNLQKPFQTRDLEKVIHELLAKRGPDARART